MSANDNVMKSSLFCRVGNLNIIDQTIRNGVDNKNKLLCEMVELFGKDDATTAKVGSTHVIMTSLLLLGKNRVLCFSCEPSTKMTKEKNCKMRKCFCRPQSCKV